MNEQNLKAITQCRLCGSKNLEEIFSLGDLFVSSFVDGTENYEQEKYPLELVLCNEKSGGCGLLQLRHTVSNEIMYRNYWYRSGTNQTMTDELKSVAAKVESLKNLQAGDYVLDIGANDGTLLRSYSAPGIRRIGFEPARNLNKWNSQGTDKIINDFFNYLAWEMEMGNAKAKAITAIAMFYDLEEPNMFVADVAKILDKDGVFIIQMSYLPLMLSQNAFDNICHEHLEYYSLLSLENLLKRHGLEIFDTELNDVNGGSFRVYIRHNGATVDFPSGEERVQKLRDDEKMLGLNDKAVYKAFANRVGDLKNKLVGFIKDETTKGKKVYVYGASTKGNTLLQFFGLDSVLIGAAAERNPDKWGKKTIGTNIPIISEEQARADKPDYFLVLPWHFMKEFTEREKDFLARGGKFIVPLPEFKIVSNE